MIRMIAKDLRINPLRTSLTALSMFSGIIALIAGVLVGTLGRDYLEAANARLGGKSPTYSAIVDVPSSVNIQVVTALQERLAHFRPGIASAQYHLNDLAIWASSGDGNTEIRRVTIIITDAERTRIMPAPIIEGTWLTGADEPATLETAVNESARQYVHDGTVALARTGNPQQVAGTGERCHRRRDGHTHHLRQRDHTATLLAASLGTGWADHPRPSQ